RPAGPHPPPSHPRTRVHTSPAPTGAGDDAVPLARSPPTVGRAPRPHRRRPRPVRRHPVPYGCPRARRPIHRREKTRWTAPRPAGPAVSFPSRRHRRGRRSGWSRGGGAERSGPVHGPRSRCSVAEGCSALGSSVMPWPSHVVRGCWGSSPAMETGKGRHGPGMYYLESVLAGARALCKCFPVIIPVRRCSTRCAPTGQLLSGRDGEFAEDVCDVSGRGGLADRQLLGDFPVGQSLLGELGDLPLPRGEGSLKVRGGFLRKGKGQSTVADLFQR